MSFKEEKYYLQLSKTSKYASIGGYVSEIDSASLFDLSQLRARFRLRYNAKFESIAFAAGDLGLRMVPENKYESNASYEFELIGECEFDDILTCIGEFTYSKGVIVREVIYSKKRNIIRQPKGNNGELKKVRYTIKKITGKCMPD